VESASSSQVPTIIAEQAPGIGAGRRGDGFVSPVVQQASDGVCGQQGRVRVLDRDQQAAVAAAAEFRVAQHREGAAGGGGEPGGLRDREAARFAAEPDSVGLEGEDAGRVERAEAAEEGRVGRAAEPAPADERGADEVGRSRRRRISARRTSLPSTDATAARTAAAAAGLERFRSVVLPI
jgi:hypothetical protein